jgi:hypothetical protein
MALASVTLSRAWQVMQVVLNSSMLRCQAMTWSNPAPP